MTEMTILAREVLSDCERLLEDLTPEMPASLWRPRWAALVALLRAVGHVLDKVDGARSPEARRAVGEAWGELQHSKPDPKIFWQFIEAERNNVLKAYAFSAGVNITVRPGLGWFNVATGESGGVPGGPATLDYFMRSGPFETQDPRQLCREAVRFWQEYLDAIDRRITNLHTGPAP